MASKSVSFFFDGLAWRAEFALALAATEDLPQPFVNQAITLAALRAGQHQAAVIGFNVDHSLANFRTQSAERIDSA